MAKLLSRVLVASSLVVAGLASTNIPSPAPPATFVPSPSALAPSQRSRFVRPPPCKVSVLSGFSADTKVEGQELRKLIKHYRPLPPADEVSITATQGIHSRLENDLT